MRSPRAAGMMSGMHAALDIAAGSRAPSADTLALEFSWALRPSGRLMLVGQVRSLEPFRVLPPDTRLWERYAAIASGDEPSSEDIRLWMRWTEPDRADAEVAIAWASWDERAPAARVLARGAVPDRWGSWAVFCVAQVQGLVDVLLAGPAPCDGSPAPYRHLPVFVDLSMACKGLGAPSRRALQAAAAPALTRS